MCEKGRKSFLLEGKYGENSSFMMKGEVHSRHFFLIVLPVFVLISAK